MNDEIPKHRSSKDTKRWCLGKPGRPHQKEWQADESYGFLVGSGKVPSHEVCVKCRKRFRHTGIGWGGRFGPGF